MVLNNDGFRINFSIHRKLSSGLEIVSTSRPNTTEPIMFKEYLENLI